MELWQRHRWPGWPGAHCLFCGKEDPRDVCTSEHGLGFFCAVCGEAGHRGLRPCPDHPPTICPAGDPLFPDPYERPLP